MRDGSLCEVSKFTGLNLPTILPILDIITRSATMVEVLCLINSRVIVMRETCRRGLGGVDEQASEERTGSRNARTIVIASHVIEDDI